jgi:hypothetical protein
VAAQCIIGGVEVFAVATAAIGIVLVVGPEAAAVAGGIATEFAVGAAIDIQAVYYLAGAQAYIYVGSKYATPGSQPGGAATLALAMVTDGYTRLRDECIGA